MRGDVATKTTLIEQLEADLTRAVCAKQSPPANVSPVQIGQQTESDVIAMAVGDGGDHNALIHHQSGDDSSLMAIVCSQRDRLKMRVKQLEAEQMAYTEQAQLLRGEVDSVREDNVKLYAKIKFLQNYTGSRPAHEVIL